MVDNEYIILLFVLNSMVTGDPRYHHLNIRKLYNVIINKVVVCRLHVSKFYSGYK